MKNYHKNRKSSSQEEQQRNLPRKTSSQEEQQRKPLLDHAASRLVKSLNIRLLKTPPRQKRKCKAIPISSLLGCSSALSSHKSQNNDPTIFGIRAGLIAIIKVEKGWITARDLLIGANKKEQVK